LLPDCANEADKFAGEGGDDDRRLFGACKHAGTVPTQTVRETLAAAWRQDEFQSRKLKLKTWYSQTE
jgi:hypothetical protein